MGGGYSGGSSNELTYYEGKNISEYGDVVFVSLNHRLNVLGFLDLSAYGDQFKYTPNLGINDLVVGLEWVNENIASFGGDPDNVTIVGQSGGGAKVTELMGVPSASGLFNRVWAMSGFTRNMTQEDSQAQTEKVLAKLGINQNNIEDIKTVPYDKLIAAANEVGCNWAPVIDGDFYPQASFDTVTGKVSPIAKDKPLIVTSTFSEFSANLPGMTWAYREGSFETTNIPSIDDEKALTMLTDVKTYLSGFDKTFRRRLRMVYWKQWKKIRTKFKYLRKLGISKHKAWEYANTRKGYWRIANSPVLSQSLSNRFLKGIGYIFFYDYYLKVTVN